MAGVEAQAEPRAAAGGLEQRRELLDRAAERAAGAGGVLQVKRAALALGERLLDRLTARADRGGGVAGLGGAGVEYDAAPPRSRGPRGASG